MEASLAKLLNRSSTLRGRNTAGEQAQAIGTGPRLPGIEWPPTFGYHQLSRRNKVYSLTLRFLAQVMSATSSEPIHQAQVRIVALRIVLKICTNLNFR